jgi:hypothetical protein
MGKKMSKFRSFCRGIHKTDAGYVPDTVDLVKDGFGDLCMAAFLADTVSELFARLYINAPEHKKNHVFSGWESKCQDAIDAYNQTIDDAREADTVMDYLREDQLQCLYDPDYKYRHFNQDMLDAGHKPSDFC